MKDEAWQVAPDNTVQVVEPPGTQKDGEGVPTKRNWASIIISLSIIFFVLLMVTIATLLMGPQNPPFFGRRMHISDLFNQDLKPKPMGVQWMAGDKLCYRSEGAGVRLLDLATGHNTTLVTELAMKQTSAKQFSVSPDMKYVLLSHDIIKGQLYTSTSLYTVYDVATNHYYPLTLSGGHSPGVGEPVRLQHAEWSGTLTNPSAPNASRSALLAISNGSVFYLPTPATDAINLTPDANGDTLTYAAPDLLYQEILTEDAALWPSPEGKSFLVASFNDSNVNRLPVLHYKGGFPTIQSLRYPIVDTPAPLVALWLYDLSSNARPFPRTRLQPPPSLRNKEHYLIGGGWANEDKVWVTWAGGDHQSSALTQCTAPFWFCTTLLLNQKKDGVSPLVKGVKWADHWAVFPWASKDSEGAWHSHVALVGEAGGRRAPLTSTNYDVTEILGANLHTQLVYFKAAEISAMKEDQYSEQIYRTSAGENSEVSCLTCDIRNKNVPFIDEHGPNYSKITEEGYFDEWCHVIRNSDEWSEQNFQSSAHDVKPDIEEQGNSSSCPPDANAISSLIGVNGQKMYQQCRSVRGYLSPSSNYLAVLCIDTNGVPPSLWLIDLKKSLNGDISNGIDSVAGTNNLPTTEAREESHQNNPSISPLLLHTQTRTRLKLGVLGLPSTVTMGFRLGVNRNSEQSMLNSRSANGRDLVFARVTLTVPPGYSDEDNTWLFPLIVEIAGPDEPSEAWKTEPEMGVQWADYLASGHQVAHARIVLWGANPSVHTSAHQLAEFHAHAVRLLLEKYYFLDEKNVAVYGRGSGATVALEAAVIASSPPLFQCVALLSPITDWHAHGVYWSERILGSSTKEGAEQLYVESDIARLAPEFRNHTPILLVHGTSDKFSHHGFSLAHALNSHSAHFSHVVYPDASPGLFEEEPHLLQAVEYFLFQERQCLQLFNPDEQ